MRLSDLLLGLESLAVSGNLKTDITSLAYDSREVCPGALFFAIHGEKTDGNRFVSDAVGRGAVAIASELPRSGQVPPPDPPGGVAWVQVSHARRGLATAAANFYGRPAQALRLVGVTGTNGKTTTTYLVDSIVRAAGYRAGMFGTIIDRTPAEERVPRTTTPESLDLQRFFAEVREAGGTHATLEVSSHGLVMDRVWGCPFAVALFTNLTREHLDFHKTFEDYFAAKRRLFEGTGAGTPSVSVVNVDDAYAKKLVHLGGRTLTYGLANGADITTKKSGLSFAGLEFTADTPAGKVEVRSRLVGRTSVYNILAAIGAGIGLGIGHEAIAEGIRQLESVPGRFERIDEGQPFLVVVDYAHTDDALLNLIETARELNKNGRLITMFGCGGERDRTKRPCMGEVAGARSELVVLTSDNPRGEDPLRIITDVVVGLQKAQAKYVVEPERGLAIARALDEARPGDVVLLAGKGHETCQILADRTIDFDDRDVARQALRERGYRRRAS